MQEVVRQLEKLIEYQEALAVELAETGWGKASIRQALILHRAVAADCIKKLKAGGDIVT